MTEKEVKYEDVEGEIVDERTGESIPKGASLMLASNQNTQIDIHKIGTLEMSPQADAVLDEPLDPKDVKIRPDGLVYLPWTYYSARLNKAFGRLQWGLLPQGAPHVKPQGDYGDMLVVWGHWFVVKGIPIGFAYGETTYKPSNNTMSYGDACEGAKSISLARNCKSLGIALELWDADWVENWKREHAEKYENPKKDARQKWLWRKKGSKPVATKPATVPQNAQNDTQDAPEAILEPNTTETTSEAESAVNVAKMLAEGFTKEQLKSAENVTSIHKAVKKLGINIPAIMKFINGMEKGQKATIDQVVKALSVKNVSEEQKEEEKTG